MLWSNHGLEKNFHNTGNLEPIILGEVSQSEKNNDCMLTHIYEFRKMVLINYLQSSKWR